MTATSVSVYCDFNPPTEPARRALYRVATEKLILDFANSGLIPTRQDLMNIHKIIMRWPDLVDDFELYEDLTDGIYTRELHMPKDMIVLGKIHKYPYHVSILKGKCLLLSEHYNKVVEAPMTFTLPAGIKHIVFNIEETVWSDVHTGNWESVQEASNEIFAETYEELDDYMKIVEVM